MDRSLAPASLDPPTELGRNLVVRPGADVPPAWSRAGRLRLDVDLATDERARDVAAALASAAIERRSLVIECPEPVDLFLDHCMIGRHSPAGGITPVTAWDLTHHRGVAGPILDELHHRVWSNAIDRRRPDEPRWSAVERARAAGARRSTGRGDVVLPDGTPVWIDAGPLRRLAPIDGVDVSPALVVETGRLPARGSGRGPAPSSAPDQHAVITSPSGSIGVVAPAGSGKTRVLADRVRHLIDDWGVPATAITVVAFNRRARQELTVRLADHHSVRVLTLNALGLSILGDAPGSRPPRTLPAPGFAALVRRLWGEQDIDDEQLAVVLDRIRRVRLGLEAPDDDPHLARLLRRIDAALERSGRIDFDGQIDAALRLLLGDRRIRHRHQAACRVLVVDEFQDLTPAHLLLVTVLVGRGGALVAVGDDDQTIYGHHGADPASLTEIERFVPGLTRYRLDVNYRCPPEVVDAASALLSHNSARRPKRIRSAPGRPVTGALEVHRVDDPLGCTVDLVAAAVGNGVAPSEIAVLARVNARLAPVAGALARRAIPMTRLDRRSRLGITPIVLDWLRRTETDVVGAEHPGCRSTDADIEHLRGLLAVGAPLGRWYEALMVEIAPDGLSRDSDAGDAIAEAIAHLDRGRRPTGGWHRELSHLLMAEPAVDPAGVVLSSVHRVKGLEWPLVIMHAVDDVQYPHRLSVDTEAERRVFHVGITRARHRLLIVSGRSPSPFIAELGRPAMGRPGGIGTVSG